MPSPSASQLFPSFGAPAKNGKPAHLPVDLPDADLSTRLGVAEPDARADVLACERPPVDRTKLLLRDQASVYACSRRASDDLGAGLGEGPASSFDGLHGAAA